MALPSPPSYSGAAGIDIKHLTLKHLEEISMIPLHPEFITKNGKKEFAFIPYEEFETLQALIADIEDLMDLRAAKEEEANQPSLPLAKVKKVLGLLDN